MKNPILSVLTAEEIGKSSFMLVNGPGASEAAGIILSSYGGRKMAVINLHAEAEPGTTCSGEASGEDASLFLLAQALRNRIRIGYQSFIVLGLGKSITQVELFQQAVAMYSYVHFYGSNDLSQAPHRRIMAEACKACHVYEGAMARKVWAILELLKGIPLAEKEYMEDNLFNQHHPASAQLAEFSRKEVKEDGLNCPTQAGLLSEERAIITTLE